MGGRPEGKNYIFEELNEGWWVTSVGEWVTGGVRAQGSWVTL